MKDAAAYLHERKRMVEDQLAGRGIHDRRVLEAMRSVPRHCFVPQEYRDMAYSDGPLPIGTGQTISQPYIVAFMSEAVALTGQRESVRSRHRFRLPGGCAGKPGTRSPYHRDDTPPWQSSPGRRWRNWAITMSTVHVGDGSKGLPEFAPYQAIVVTASAPKVPKPLLDQLDEGGRLILPVGDRWGGQTLQLWERHGDHFEHETILAVAFVPLRGEYGWKEDEIH